MTNSEITAVRNPHASPPLIIKQEKVFSRSVYNRNHYSRDGVALDADDLSAIERGHVYRCEKEEVRGGMRYRVRGIRIADEETAELVAGLSSLTSTLTQVVERYGADASKVQMLGCDFLLSEADFLLFREAVTRRGGRIQLIEVTEEDIDVHVLELTTLIDAFDGAVRRVRTDITALGVISADEEYRQALEAVEGLKELQISIFEEMNTVRDLLTRAPAFGVASSFLVMKETTVGVLQGRLSAVRGVRTAGLSADIRLRLENRTRSVRADPTQLYPLSYDIERLAKSYPVLSCIKVVDNNTLELDIEGLKITITPKSLSLDGSPDALRLAQQGMRRGSGGGGPRSRFGDV